MKIALVQQRATADKSSNLDRGLRAVKIAAWQGAELICFAELAFEPFYPQGPADGGGYRDAARRSRFRGWLRKAPSRALSAPS